MSWYQYYICIFSYAKNITIFKQLQVQVTPVSFLPKVLRHFTFIKIVLISWYYFQIEHYYKNKWLTISVYIYHIYKTQNLDQAYQISIYTSWNEQDFSYLFNSIKLFYLTVQDFLERVCIGCVLANCFNPTPRWWQLR